MTNEKGFERLICTALTGAPCNPGGGASGYWRSQGMWGVEKWAKGGISTCLWNTSDTQTPLCTGYGNI